MRGVETGAVDEGMRTWCRAVRHECGEPATFKVAAPWSDQRFWELKTYGFACRDHVRDVLRSAEARWLDYEPVKGEVVGYLGMYEYEVGRKDRELIRVELDEEEEDRWRAGAETAGSGWQSRLPIGIDSALIDGDT